MPEEVLTQPWQLRVLVGIALAEAAAMAVFLAHDWLSVLTESSVDTGALAFVTVMFGLWIPWLVLSALALRRGRRWGFTPIVMTQLVFGGIAAFDFAAAQPVAKVVLGAVFVVAVVAMFLAFSAPVRAVVAPPQSGDRRRT